MPDEPESPTVQLPPPQPMVEEPVPAADPPDAQRAAELYRNSLARLRPDDIAQIVEGQRCLTKYRGDLREAVQRATKLRAKYCDKWTRVKNEFQLCQEIVKEELRAAAEIQKIEEKIAAVLAKTSQESKEVEEIRTFLGVKYQKS